MKKSSTEKLSTLKSLAKNKGAQKTTIGAALLLAVGFFAFGDGALTPSSAQQMAKTSVKVVRSDGRSGGTGVILESTPSESTILTNSHVCGVVQNGGLVITDDGREHSVTSFKRSEEADLCLITVASNLGVNTKIAKGAPAAYSDAAISGHPSLLPNIVTRGHFSGRMMVEVMTGFRPCTEEDSKNENAILCTLLGGIPHFHRYETQVVSAMIMPGSSGSAVFNSDGEISALVFAGSGQLGYAMTMTVEAIQNFVYRESRLILKQAPNNGTEPSLADAQKRIREACSSPDTADLLKKEIVSVQENFRNICEMIQKDVLWTS